MDGRTEKRKPDGHHSVENQKLYMPTKFHDNWPFLTITIRKKRRHIIYHRRRPRGRKDEIPPIFDIFSLIRALGSRKDENSHQSFFIITITRTPIKKCIILV